MQLLSLVPWVLVGAGRALATPVDLALDERGGCPLGKTIMISTGRSVILSAPAQQFSVWPSSTWEMPLACKTDFSITAFPDDADQWNLKASRIIYDNTCHLTVAEKPKTQDVALGTIELSNTPPYIKNVDTEGNVAFSCDKPW